MPAASTHVEFAREVINQMPSSLQEKITNRPLYYLGAQGPDLFFFSSFHFLPGSLKKCGNIMHQDKVRETLSFLDRYTRDMPNLRNYYYGFLCHYALDSYAHPLIHYYSKKQAQQENRNETEIHFTNEAYIDVWALERNQKKPQDYDIYVFQKINKVDAQELSSLFHILFREVYGWTIPLSKIKHTITQEDIALTLLRPTKPWKYTVVQKAESLLKIPHLISGMMLFEKNKMDSEVFNHSHKTYEMVGRNQTDTRSFQDLYEEAIPYAISLCQQLNPEEIHYDFNGALLLDSK